MRIMFRAVTMMVGGLMLFGFIGLLLWTQVLAAWPMRTEPTTPEDIAMWRKLHAEAPASASQFQNSARRIGNNRAL